jgi:hypothetical protein
MTPQKFMMVETSAITAVYIVISLGLARRSSVDNEISLSFLKNLLKYTKKRAMRAMIIAHMSNTAICDHNFLLKMTKI